MTELVQAVADASGFPLGRWDRPVQIDGVRVRFRAERAHSAVRHLAELSEAYDLMVVGAGPGGTMSRDVLGRFTRILADESKCSVVAVKRRTGALHFHLQSFFHSFKDEEKAALRELGHQDTSARRSPER